LVGDSMAKSLSDGFAKASENLGMKSAVFSLAGCAFLLENSPIVSNDTRASWRANVFDAIQFLQPDVVVIANLSSLYIDILNQTSNPQESMDFWASELGATLTSTMGETSGVLLVQPPPRFAKDVRYEISLIKPIGEPEERSEVQIRRSSVNLLEQMTIAADDLRIQVLNFDDIFCGQNTCTQVVEGQLMYEDFDHLTPQGSLLLVGKLEEKIKLLLSL